MDTLGYDAYKRQYVVYNSRKEPYAWFFKKESAKKFLEGINKSEKNSLTKNRKYDRI